MKTTKMSSQGRVILPKAILESRGWSAGTLFAIETAGKGVLLRPLPASSLKGVDEARELKRRGKGVFRREMKQSISEGIVKEGRGKSRD